MTSFQNYIFCDFVEEKLYVGSILKTWLRLYLILDVLAREYMINDFIHTRLSLALYKTNYLHSTVHSYAELIRTKSSCAENLMPGIICNARSFRICYPYTN